MRFRAQWKRDLAVAKKPLPWRIILGVICVGVFLSLALDHFLGPALVPPSIVTLSSLAYVAWFKRALRREFWFRVVMSGMIGLHGVAIVCIPWTYRDLPGRTVGGAFVLDVCFMLGVVNGVGVYLEGKKKVVRRRAAFE